jgi:predicted RNA-binding protein
MCLITCYLAPNRVKLKKEIKGRKTKIDLSEYNPGVYTITVISEETVFTGKIIKK